MDIPFNISIAIRTNHHGICFRFDKMTDIKKFVTRGSFVPPLRLLLGVFNFPFLPFFLSTSVNNLNFRPGRLLVPVRVDTVHAFPQQDYVGICLAHHRGD